MARLNTASARPAARGPIRSTGVTGRTREGAIGFERDQRSELFLAAVSSFNEDTFYETADARVHRIRHLARSVAVDDPAWMVGLVGWLRRVANLRTIPLIVAAEAVKGRLDAEETGFNRDIVKAAIVRADEPGEFLAYWLSRFGRTVPSAVKRGLADAVDSTLTEVSWMKWRGKGDRGSVSVADVLNLTHAKPRDEYRDALYGAVLAHAYGRETDLSRLPVARRRAEFLALDEDAQVAYLTGEGAAERIRIAGLSHEVIAGALGTIPASVWASLVPNLGYQALLMNLRRIAASGVSDDVLDEINARLRDPEQVRASRMYPMRFLSAYRQAPLEFAGSLERAANATLENVPALRGRSLILVDRSASMGASLSQRGTLKRVDGANVFGAALALRAEHADLVAFGTRSEAIRFRRGDSLLRLANHPANMGGTMTRDAIARHYSGHDRVIVVTDEQRFGYAWDSDARQGVFRGTVPDTVPCFTWNLAGYKQGHDEDGPRRFTFGGLSDAGFDLIETLERGFSAGWPWEK